MPEKPDITQITKQLLASPTGGIYILYGGEEFLKRHFLSDLKKKLIPDNFAEFNYSEFCGAEQYGKASDACSTLPQFAENRLVVWFNSGFPSFMPKFKAGEDGVLADAADYPYLTLVIYLYASELDAGDYNLMRKFNDYKIGEDKLKATRLFFDFLPPRKLAGWISRHFKASGITISDEDNTYLAQRCGGDMNALSGQIDKLCIYEAQLGKTAVTRDDIELIVPAAVSFDNFFVSNCVRARNIPGLLDYLTEAEAVKKPSPVILYMISKEAAGLYAAKCARKDGLSYTEFAKAEKISEYPAKLAYAAVAPVSEKYLRGLLRRCWEADVMIKNSSDDDYGILRQLVCLL